MTGQLPELPWWPFPVIAELERLIEPTWDVLEVWVAEYQAYGSLKGLRKSTLSKVLLPGVRKSRLMLRAMG